ncbi:hypothetical protein C5167_034758 [Papaver somniferum]|uniref:Armadillo-like repeats domain-containing protein n=1 Tax=Papaver somniferum TaxID=3469 RepID=A0A4Y7KI06_PAPSO|nr:hypothetical protein C5167_034758 [Papaver somniferum]
MSCFRREEMQWNQPVVRSLCKRFWNGGNLEEVYRHAMNEKPFNPDMVANLIQLRKSSMLNDSEVAEILNEISRRFVRDKEKGFKRKFAAQALFGKIFFIYPSEDAITLRAHTLSEAGDVESLHRMLGNSNPQEPNEGLMPKIPQIFKCRDMSRRTVLGLA